MFVDVTPIAGLVLLSADLFEDERGSFCRLFCEEELKSIKSPFAIKQINLSKTALRGTIRGMHFQYPPHMELKIVRCLKGSVFDVAVDLRKDSPTFLQWHGEILSANELKALVIPEGCAHGFQSLEDNIEMLYFHTEFYHKEAEGAIRFDDPKINIGWPINPASFISQRDLSHPYLSDEFEGIDL